MMLLRSSPTGLPALAVLAVAFGAFVVALLLARMHAGPRAASAGRRDRSSIGAIAVQALGIGIVGFGRIDVRLVPTSPGALVQAVAVAALMAGAIGLFHQSSRAMGNTWAIVASTRSDHRLVTDGPFALMRNPIYVALLLFQLAMAVAYGHYRQLAIGVPVYWLGTLMRVRIEERMLHAQFGAAYDAYRARVKRFGIL